MALSATAVWEWRADTGNNLWGGIYKSDAGTTDYSQADSAELSVSDIATDGAGTGVSSATGGFTAQMVGNGINISGGSGLTPGIYEITAHTDTNNITIDRSAGASGSGGTGNVGGALALFTDPLMETSEPGNIHYVRKGAYTLTGAVSIAKDGTVVLPIKLIGYTSTRDDTTVGDDRPLVAAGANSFIFGDYWNIFNLKVTTTNASGIYVFTGNEAHNVFSNNSSGTAREGIRLAAGGSLHDCEAISSAGECIAVTGGNTHIIRSIMRDSATGLSFSAADCDIIESHFDTLTTAGASITSRNVNFYSNVFYACADGILGTTPGASFIMNNIFKDCTGTAVNMNATAICTLDYNNFHGNSTDVSNVNKGAHTISTDPGFTDAANNDFSTDDNAKVTVTFTDQNSSSTFRVGANKAETSAAQQTAVGSVS
jgi:hypothetical protein